MATKKEVWQDDAYRAKQMQARKHYYESQKLKDQIKNNPLMGAPGEGNGFYGKEHDESTKERIAEAHKKNWQFTSDEDKAKRMAGIDNKISILDTSTGLEYPSITAAAEVLGINKSTLSKMLKGKIANTTSMIKNNKK